MARRSIVEARLAPRFRRREATAKGVRRIARTQIDLAVAAIGEPALSRDAALHQVRQTGKRLRALLRLVRPHFAAHAELEHRVAEAIGKLSPLRDAEVALKTYSELIAAVGIAPDPRLQSLLMERRGVATLEVDPALRETAAMLTRFADDAADWRFEARGYALVGDGLGLTYRSLRRTGRRATDDPTPDLLHDWRKHVKYLQYELELIRQAAPHALKRDIATADALAETLGAHHDLDMLRAIVAEAPGIGGAQLHAAIDLRQGELTRYALRLGDRLMVESTRHFSARIARYWWSWHA